MRNVLLVPNYKRKNHMQALAIVGVLFVLLVILFIFVMLNFFGNDISYVSEVRGMVEKVEQNDDDRYLITLEQGDEYCLDLSVSEHVEESEIQNIVGQEAVLYLYDYTSDNDIIGFSTSVYSIDLETGYNYLVNSDRAVCIVIGVFTGVMLIVFVVEILLFARTKKQVRGDVFKLMNETTKGIVTTSPFRKKMMQFMCIPLVLALFLLIPLFTYIGINLTVTFVCLGVFLACVIGLIIALIIMLPNIQKREFELYSGLLDGLENLPEKEYSDIVMDVGNMFSFKLTEEGLLYNKINEVDFIINNLYQDLPNEDKEAIRAELMSELQELPPDGRNKHGIDYTEGSELEDGALLKYDELNLDTKVCFRTMNLPIAIFITSNLSEEQFPSMRNDIFLELSEDLYYYLKKFNIHVSGLEKVLKNKMEYMKKYCGSVYKGDRNTYVEITDDGEKVLFEDKKSKKLSKNRK